MSSRCYAKERKEPRVNPVVINSVGGASDMTCFHCGEKGHIARHCKKPPQKRNYGGEGKPPGNERGRLEGGRPTVFCTQ